MSLLEGFLLMVNIRKAEGEDLEFIKALDRENMEPILHDIGKEYTGLYNAFDLDKCFIIEGTERIGFAFFELHHKELHIASLQIREKYQGEGYGKKLMNYIIDFGKRNNLERITLDAQENNKPAIKFYEKLGFDQVGFREKDLIFEFSF